MEFNGINLRFLVDIKPLYILPDDPFAEEVLFSMFQVLLPSQLQGELFSATDRNSEIVCNHSTMTDLSGISQTHLPRFKC